MGLHGFQGRASRARLINRLQPTALVHMYEVRPRTDRRGVDLISDVLPFGRSWYDTPDNAIGYAMHSSRSHDTVIRAYDADDNIVERHEHNGDFNMW
jgi:hypothetical protein